MAWVAFDHHAAMIPSSLAETPLTQAMPGFACIYTDDSLLVLNKPSGLLCVPGRGEDKQDCLSKRVQSIYPDALIVHRLDMATSGLLLMARSPAMQRALGSLFELREVSKRYIAVVEGDMRLAMDAQTAAADLWQLIDLPIAVDWPNRPLRIIEHSHGKPSQTRWRLLGFDALTGSSRLELAPLTGRSHQLRVHLQALGHPIRGDMLYAGEAVQANSDRLLLHASALGFTHPETGEPMAFELAPTF